ncbi:MAG: hypothetical protein ACP5L4_06920, partial [Thermoplasmata archaeon]
MAKRVSKKGSNGNVRHIPIQEGYQKKEKQIETHKVKKSKWDMIPDQIKNAWVLITWANGKKKIVDKHEFNDLIKSGLAIYSYDNHAIKNWDDLIYELYRQFIEDKKPI